MQAPASAAGDAPAGERVAGSRLTALNVTVFVAKNDSVSVVQPAPQADRQSVAGL